MTDWNKLKVVDLKEECKSRGIPLTGLKLKQHYVDKLEEYEAGHDIPKEEVEPGGEEEPVEAAPEGDSHEPSNIANTDEQVKDDATTTRTPPQPHGDKDAVGIPDANGDTDASHGKPGTEGIEDASPETAKTETREQENETPVEGQIEDSEPAEPQKEDGGGENEEEMANAPATSQSETVKDELSTLEPQQPQGEVEATEQERPSAAAEKVAIAEDSSNRLPLVQSHSDRSTPLPPGDFVEDQTRRRKRSATPVPTAQELARKKARLSSEGEDEKAGEVAALQEMKAATEAAKDIRNESADAITKTINHQAASAAERMPSQSPSEEHEVPPAIHPATSSIYIRNLKRPLHIPSLRNHILTLAKSRDPSDDIDPIKVFYLDSIRTHAFVSFSSVSSASRVRTAMHGTRFPDENMREPLFVDYIPDDKVQDWIERETGGGFGGGRAGGRRYEVVYEEGQNGVEAIFQEVDTTKPQQQRPPLEPRLSSRMSIDRPAGGEVHPDRAGLVPRSGPRDDYRDRDRPRGPQQPPTGPKRQDTSGRGFKALDELFDSTTAKPKLYFKPVPEAVARERQDMFRDLRLSHGEMGRSGDEGMKRYSFERFKDREEWADKGPEFGFGKRGQDRLTGTRGRGGYRGRGGDSWRGGSGR
ncbi:hypothetical protein PV08_03924 [Exophiala spinifera]|uniref:SAP domain-containing protein n=1 Tax=Exophiala spinifera TaxID=91928 RepID=A0A0D2BDN4_9EURO|nr:uncharacterized protein PV08_03924 [Exophiala spinifera]KIW16735.1 hypothetical protein PV08_03924 [Exophiala spinifera]